MCIGKSGGIPCRDDAAFPRTEKSEQSPRLDVSDSSNLLGMRLFTIHRPENGIGVAGEPHPAT